MAQTVRTHHLFDPASESSYKLSRTKLALFLECPRCFYLDRRCSVSRPDNMVFSLNNAVDVLLKREFDTYRAHRETPPLLQTYGVEAVPFHDPRMDDWRDISKGIQFQHRSGFLVFGAVDDVWQTPEGELIVVDYKATSTERTLTSEDAIRDGYKRQLEIYQWLLRSIGEKVSETAYILYANGDRTKDAFNRTLQFSMTLLPYQGETSWVDDALDSAHECLMSEKSPPPVTGCEWCEYRRRAGAVKD